jgi:ribosomal protein S6
MQNYELMVIFTPVLSEEEFKTAQKKYVDFITAGGGSLVHRPTPSRRRLRESTGLWNM